MKTWCTQIHARFARRGERGGALHAGSFTADFIYVRAFDNHISWPPIGDARQSKPGIPRTSGQAKERTGKCWMKE